MNINVSGLAALKIGNSSFPKEGAKCLSLALDFSEQPSYALSVGDVYNQGAGYPGFSNIQTLFIDNSENDMGVAVQIQGSSQTIKAPPSTQGYYPIISPRIGQMIFASAGGVLVRVNLLNVPIPAAQWGAASGFSGGEFTPQGLLEVSNPALEALIANGALTVSDKG